MRKTRNLIKTSYTLGQLDQALSYFLFCSELYSHAPSTIKNEEAALTVDRSDHDGDIWIWIDNNYSDEELRELVRKRPFESIYQAQGYRLCQSLHILALAILLDTTKTYRFRNGEGCEEELAELMLYLVEHPVTLPALKHNTWYTCTHDDCDGFQEESIGVMQDSQGHFFMKTVKQSMGRPSIRFRTFAFGGGGLYPRVYVALLLVILAIRREINHKKEGLSQPSLPLDQEVR